MICSGKSTFLNIAENHDYRIIKSDQIVDSLYTRNEVIEEFRLAFPYLSLGTNIKESLTEIFFESKKNMKIIESIIHPYVFSYLDKALAAENKIMVELPLLEVNKNYFSRFRTIYLECDEEIRKVRYCESRNDSIERFNVLNNLQINQLDIEYKFDIIINNNANKDILLKEFKKYIKI